jgi:hypothetical protein
VFPVPVDIITPIIDAIARARSTAR